MKKIVSNIALLATVLLMSTTAFANPDGPDEGEEPVPVNDWVLPVLVAGAAYAFTKVRQTKKA
jgi:hypothetical protein